MWEEVLDHDLLAPASTHRLQSTALDRVRSVWLGIGLCSGTALSRGLPVDVLAMLLAQESLRRGLRLQHSDVLLADSNAVAVGFSRSEVADVTARTQRVLERLGELLGLPLRCVRGSEVAPWSTVARHPPAPQLDPYEVHQIVQMHAMAERGATLKVGWTMSAGSHDEAYFDRCFEVEHPGEMAFVYAVCGRALHHRRPRACPYVAVHPEERVLLERGENVFEKFAGTPGEHAREVSGYRRLLRKIGRSVARLRGERAPRDAERVVQALLDSL